MESVIHYNVIYNLLISIVTFLIPFSILALYVSLKSSSSFVKNTVRIYIYIQIIFFLYPMFFRLEFFRFSIFFMYQKKKEVLKDFPHSFQFDWIDAVFSYAGFNIEFIRGSSATRRECMARMMEFPYKKNIPSLSVP